MSRPAPCRPRRRGVLAGAAALLGSAAGPPARAQSQGVRLPVLVPLTGFLSLEGTSQRNGALLAVRELAPKVVLQPEVIDTTASPEGAVTAWQRALRDGVPPAVVGPILGTQMLALLPLAAERQVPLLTISGTARLAEAGNPWFFRFFPSDATVKVAHARYVVEKLGAKRPAVVFQTTAYGQSGREQLATTFAGLGATPVLEEGVAPTVNDLSPVLGKVRGSGADALVLHLHAQSTALAVRQARTLLPGLPIVAGSAMHQPATAQLLEPAELKGVCAETASSPVAASTPAIQGFLERYRNTWRSDPDAFALAQYDAVMALGAVLAELPAGTQARGEDVRRALAGRSFEGLAMRYRSDGKGNMAHAAVIVCFDGSDRIPRVEAAYNL
jgi:branched-chain amino acid transport system substrate-binding protein